MKFLKMLLIIPPILVGVAVLMYMKAQKQPPQTHKAVEVVRQVRVIEAKKVPVVPRVHGFGVVSPGKEWVATAQVSGEIIKVHPDLKKGSLVKAGSVIVTISPVDFELAIAQARANIRSTDAKIAELDINRQNTQNILKLEKDSLKIREGELARQQELVKKGTVSRTSFDRETRDTFVQRKKVQDLENSLRLIPTQLVVQKEQREVFKAQLQSALLNLQRTKITLPFDARISEVDAEVAQFAQSGKTLAKADSVASSEIEAQIPISKFMNLLKAASGTEKPNGINTRSLDTMTKRLGLQAHVYLDTAGQRIAWEARLARISDLIDPQTRTVGVIAIVDGAYAQAVPGVRPPLAKGMFVEMELTARALGTHLIVPRLALKGNELYVVGKDNRLEMRQVEIGLVQDDFAIISKGLKEGDKIVVSDLSPAIKGMLLGVEIDSGLSDQLAKQASGAEQAR